jgi:hypothetical protein
LIPECPSVGAKKGTMRDGGAKESLTVLDQVAVSIHDLEFEAGQQARVIRHSGTARDMTRTRSRCFPAGRFAAGRLGLLGI